MYLSHSLCHCSPLPCCTNVLLLQPQTGVIHSSDACFGECSAAIQYLSRGALSPRVQVSSGADDVDLAQLISILYTTCGFTASGATEELVTRIIPLALHHSYKRESGLGAWHVSAVVRGAQSVAASNTPPAQYADCMQRLCKSVLSLGRRHTGLKAIALAPDVVQTFNISLCVAVIRKLCGALQHKRKICSKRCMSQLLEALAVRLQQMLPATSKDSLGQILCAYVGLSQMGYKNSAIEAEVCMSLMNRLKCEPDDRQLLVHDHDSLHSKDYCFLTLESACASI